MRFNNKLCLRYLPNIIRKRGKKMISQHEIALDTPVLYLKSEEAFKGLNDNEKRFGHHLSKASWWGNLIIFCQKSPESPILFNLFNRLFRSEPLNSLKEIAIGKGEFTEDEFKNLLLYYSVLMYNSGNYLGFGDRKFVPTVSKEKLIKLIKYSKCYLEMPDLIDTYLNECSDAIYDLLPTKRFLGMPGKGVTMYFTPNCNEADEIVAKEYMLKKGIEAWNTRLLKYECNGKTILDIRIASVLKDHAKGITHDVEQFNGHNIKVSRGDYSFALKEMIKELELAKKFGNSLEIKMLNAYIEHFSTGSLEAHKTGSSYWVKNLSPSVETYMGFIEVYTDPTNQRAEFESFVAIVNREQSRKYDLLVSKADKEFLPLLPWGSSFEEDLFKKPDFSALDILTFATSGLPIGINIPNYKDVKEEVGFKNVTLANVMSTRSTIKGGPFLSKEDHVVREKYASTALEIDVGLHELLGHGSGKFLRRKEDGTLNFDIDTVKNPFTGGKVTFYEKGENFNTIFSDLGSAYEECRAEAVALYLGLNDSVLDIFDIKPEDRDNIKYIIWLDMFYGGLKGLELYQLDKKNWGQAHCNARFVLLQVGIESGIANVQETVGEDGLPDLLLSLDCSKLFTSGKEAIGLFLKKLQVYRSMADIKNARTLFEKYSEVKEDGSHPFAKWHEIVVRKRKPRLVLTLPNTKIVNDKVTFISYPDGPEGKVASWMERFSTAEYDYIEEGLLDFAQNCTK